MCVCVHLTARKIVLALALFPTLFVAGRSQNSASARCVKKEGRARLRQTERERERERGTERRAKTREQRSREASSSRRCTKRHNKARRRRRSLARSVAAAAAARRATKQPRPISIGASAREKTTSHLLSLSLCLGYRFPRLSIFEGRLRVAGRSFG